MGVVLGLLVEYHVTFPLTRYPNTVPPIYRILAHQPRGIVAEFPAPRADALPGHDAEYAYMSTFHWLPLVNGYSGVYPQSYLARLDRLLAFPDARALAQLRRDNVAYVHAPSSTCCATHAAHSSIVTTPDAIATISLCG